MSTDSSSTPIAGDSRPSLDNLMEGIKSGDVALTQSSESALNIPESDNEGGNESPNQVDELREFINSEDELGLEDSSEDNQDSDELSQDLVDSVTGEDSETEEDSAADIEEVTITDTKGRRKVKIDFKDREKLKKYAQLAYGSRKWQKERDTARKELADIKERTTEDKSTLDKLEGIFSAEGPKGVIAALLPDGKTFDDWFQEESRSREAFNDMSDFEKEAYHREEQTKKEALANDKLRAEYEQKLAEIQTEREQSETRALESKMHPSFDRYRFSGKLDDPIAEHQMDQALWNQAISNLEELPEDIELTQAIIDKEFRKVSAGFNKVINKQATKNTKKAITKAKNQAASKAQATVRKGIKKNAEVEEFRKHMKSGNMVDGLTSFFRAGGKLQ